MAGSRKRPLQTIWAPVALAVAAASLGFFIYRQISSSSAKSNQPSTTKVKPNARIAVVLSPQLSKEGVPISLLLSRYSELVILLAPGVSKATIRQSGQVPVGAEYRIIPADTEVGVTHVIKHLRSDLVVLPSDFPRQYIPDIKRFVRTVILLDQTVELANQQFKQIFF